MILATLCFLILAIELSLLFKRNISDTLPVSCMIMIGCAYVFALFDGIKYSYILIVILIAAIGLHNHIGRWKNHDFFRRISENKENVFNPSLLIFFLMLALLYFMNFSTYVFQWDEFSHWSTTVKEMYYTGRLSIQEDSITNFRSYPPAMSCWQYLFVSTSKKWADWKIVYAYNVFLVAFMMPMVRKLNRKRFCYVPIAAIVMYLIPFIYESPGEGTPWHCIYIERALSIVFAYSLFMFFSAKLKRDDALDTFTFWSAIASLCVLSLLKSIGLALAFFVVFLMAADTLLCKKEVNKQLIRLLLASVLIFMINRTWTLKLLLNGVPKNWNASGIGIEQILKLLSGNEEPYRYEIVKGFYQNVLYSGIQYFTGIIKICMIGFPVIWAAILLVIFIRNGNSMARSIVIPIILFIGFLLYELCVLMLELYILPQAEAVPSSARYSSVYILGVTAFVIMLLFHYLLCEDKGRPFINCGILAVFLFLAVSQKVAIYCMFNSDEFLQTRYITNGFDRFIGLEDSVGKVISDDDSVYILTADDAYGYYALRKVFLPGKTMNSTEQITLENSIENWPDYIVENGFDYVFVNKSREDFNEKYEALFDENCVSEMTLYKVCTDGKDLQLKSVPLE